MKGCSKWMQDGNDNIRVVEDLDNYWKSLDEFDHSWTVKEEENSRKFFGKILTTRQYHRASMTKPTKGKTLKGVHSYDILANPNYADDFQYIPSNVANRKDLIIDSEPEDDSDNEQQCNLTRVALNLGCLEPQTTKSFKFCKKSMQ